jgi:hypothetical protein
MSANHEDTYTSLALVVIVVSMIALVAIAGCAGTTRQSCEIGATYDGSSPVVVATYRMEVR